MGAGNGPDEENKRGRAAEEAAGGRKAAWATREVDRELSAGWNEELTEEWDGEACSWVRIKIMINFVKDYEAQGPRQLGDADRGDAITHSKEQPSFSLNELCPNEIQVKLFILIFLIALGWFKVDLSTLQWLTSRVLSWIITTIFKRPLQKLAFINP